jgi:transposase
MAPQFARPYVKNNKNVWLDMETICQVVARRTLRYVPVKFAEQSLTQLL